MYEGAWVFTGNDSYASSAAAPRKTHEYPTAGRHCWALKVVPLGTNLILLLYVTDWEYNTYCVCYSSHKIAWLAKWTVRCTVWTQNSKKKKPSLNTHQTQNRKYSTPKTIMVFIFELSTLGKYLFVWIQNRFLRLILSVFANTFHILHFLHIYVPWRRLSNFDFIRINSRKTSCGHTWNTLTFTASTKIVCAWITKLKEKKNVMCGSHSQAISVSRRQIFAFTYYDK